MLLSLARIIFYYLLKERLILFYFCNFDFNSDILRRIIIIEFMIIFTDNYGQNRQFDNLLRSVFFCYSIINMVINYIISLI